MFRIITEQTEKPAMFLLCDDGRCGFVASMMFEPNPALNIASVQGQFIEGAIQQGWMVTLGKQLCPYHRAELGKQQQNRIIVPSLALN